MEVSAFPANHQTLISSSSSSTRHFLLLPTSVRRHFLLPYGGGGGGGRLLSSQKRGRRITDPPRCLLRDFPYETSGLAAAAVAATAHAAFQALVAQLDSGASAKQKEFFSVTSNRKGGTKSGEFLVVEHIYANASRHERGRNVIESFHDTLQSTRGKKKQKTMSMHDFSENGKFLVSENQVAKLACGKEELDISSISCFNDLDAKPLCLTLEEKHLSHSQFRHTMKYTDSNVRKFTLRAGEGAPATGFPLASMGIEREPHKIHEITGESGRNSKYKREESVLSILGQQIGDYSEGPFDFVSGLRRYSILLGDSRLRECVDLLESMERKGFLDMEKVHHMSFLKACKSQKAVKEAFRFCRLIRSPTMSTFNTLLSVCASSQDFDGAVQVMLLIKEAGLKPDCKLYTTLISTCAKSGKVDAMFEVFHEMLNAGVEPNVNTYGALIDGCAKAGQVAKAFGAYGIMRSKKVQPDRVVFNALITACGESGAVDRAFDVLAEMKAEPKPIEPDHVTIGALMKACSQGGQVDRTREVYKMLQEYNIRGTTEVYTIAVKNCSQRGDLEFALNIYDDMKKKRVAPDEMFLSTIIDVAGHAGNVDAAFEIIKEAREEGVKVGTMSYSSLMGACCNAKNWKKALELYEEIKDIKLLPTVSMLNALITSLCDGDQVLKSVEVLDETKKLGVHPNVITYSVLIVACEKNGEAELAFTLFSEAKKDGIQLNLIMCRCLTGLCLQSYRKAYSRGESVVVFNSGHPQIDSNWTSLAIAIYRQSIQAGVIPPIEVFAQILGCLQFSHDCSLRAKFIENLGHGYDASASSNISSMLDGFGEYDTRAFSILEEATSLGIVPCVSFKESPIVLDAKKLPIHVANVCLLMILKGLKHRLAGGTKLPNITVLLPIEKTEIGFSKGDKTISVAGRVGQSVGSLLRRVGLPYQGDESYGKIRIQGLAMKRWFKPKLASSLFTERPAEMISSPSRLAKGITDQQRSIRNMKNLSLD